jgi:hypothetical protein
MFLLHHLFGHVSGGLHHIDHSGILVVAIVFGRGSEGEGEEEKYGNLFCKGYIGIVELSSPKPFRP